MFAIHELFTKYRLEWMAGDVGLYSEEMVRQFYPSYVVTLRSQLHRRAATANHASLEYV